MRDVSPLVLSLTIGAACIDCHTVGRLESFCFFGIFSFPGPGGWPQELMQVRRICAAG
uniref:Uncharacterized protein n=1 Tax=Physcomitrium patens TaxID=3218 RepID=A0A2K1IHC7_PHYPA|nr:hypothetical protein PHYPA_029280 [Physcomitrium patens]